MNKSDLFWLMCSILFNTLSWWNLGYFEKERDTAIDSLHNSKIIDSETGKIRDMTSEDLLSPNLINMKNFYNNRLLFKRFIAFCWLFIMLWHLQNLL